MSFEIEQKYRVENHEAPAERLTDLGCAPGESLEQEDTYLSHPSRDFAKSGEAFRVRRIGVRNAITYKGPRFAGPTKTRREIEIDFAEGTKSHAGMIEVYESLGFARVAVVRKVRTPYHVNFDGRDLEVVLDAVDGIGTFVEVEAIAEDDDDLAGAQEAVVGLSLALGLKEPEPRSYLRMLLEREAAGPSA